jgi:hypothetical protein
LHRKGGKLQAREPFFGTNSNTPATWLRLAGNAQFCKFTAKDKSSIFVRLFTLYTKQPTLAALAYYAKVPFNQKTCAAGANPGSCYCSQLGGSDAFGGVNVANGAWVLKSEKANEKVSVCIFPDLSSIDSFGLFYHSAGKIEGKNLKGVLRYAGPSK